MNEYFKIGFEKVAGKEEVFAGLAALGLLGAMGAGFGHLSHVQDKLDAAKHGDNDTYKGEEGFIERNPRLSGALSLGLAPAISAGIKRQVRNMGNPDTLGVIKKHPIVTRMMGEV